jgi:hypothetical protein
MGSNVTRGMDACVPLFCVFVVLHVGSDLATRWSPSKGSYRLCVGLRNWKGARIQQRAVEPSMNGWMISTLLFGMCSILIYRGLFCVSLNPSRKNSRISPRLGHDCFLYNPFQFIIHQLSHHFMLYILDTEVVIQFTDNKMKCNKCGTKPLWFNLKYCHGIIPTERPPLVGEVSANFSR